MYTSSPLYKDLSVPAKSRTSHRTSARFFYLVDAIARHHEPTETQLIALESSYRSTAEFLIESPEFSGLLTEVHPHGSRQLGTMTRPTNDGREGFDIDWVARLGRHALQRYGGEPGPTQLLADLHTVLKRYADRHQLVIRRWERCITLEYAEGMSADVAPVIDDPLISAPYGTTHGLIPDRKLRSYEKTNPRGYSKYFDEVAAISPEFTSDRRFVEAMDAITKSDIAPLPDAQEVFERLVSRLIQLLKLHRNVAFGIAGPEGDLSPPSIFITTLAAMAYADLAPLPHEDPLDLLLAIVEAMPKYFIRIPRADGREFWHLANPSSPGENLAECMNIGARQEAFGWWQGKLQLHISDILAAIEHDAGLDVLLLRVEAAFGKRAAQGIRNEQANNRSAGRQAGRIALIGAAVAPVSSMSRNHTFFGEP